MRICISSRWHIHRCSTATGTKISPRCGQTCWGASVYSLALLPLRYAPHFSHCNCSRARLCTCAAITCPRGQQQSRSDIQRNLLTNSPKPVAMDAQGGGSAQSICWEEEHSTAAMMEPPSETASRASVCRGFCGWPYLAEAGGGGCTGRPASVGHLVVRRTALFQHACLKAGSHMGVCSHIHGLLLRPADIQPRITIGQG